MPVHTYSIQPKDIHAHLFEVRVTVAKPASDGQKIAIPAWVPGSYMVRDFARNVVAIRAESDGVAVPIRKIDKSTWQAEPTDRALTVVMEVFAYDPGVRGAHLDSTHAYFNGACVFPAIVGQQDCRCKVDILPSEDGTGKHWRVATSMQRDGAEQYGYGGYQVADYDELIDHPVEIAELTIGEFEALGIPHAIAIRGKVNCDMARLCHDLKTLCEQHLSFLGVPEDLDRYVFLLYAPGTGYGGLEHRWSSSNICSRDNLPYKGLEGVNESYGTFLGLVSHEYFHLWNVKRIRPAAFANSDLASEAYTELLWVFEGITSYYDDLQLLRSGLITTQQYLKLLGQTITRVERGAGRRRQSVADSSFDAWIKFYKPDANAGNAIVSYYAKGALIALCLDLKLRLETEGRVSLDDVMHESWRRFGVTGKGMLEPEFEEMCAEVSGLDLGDFFDAAVRGTGELPLENLLHRHGVLWKKRRPASRDDKGGDKGDPAKALNVTIGATLTEQNGRSVFTVIDNDSAAEKAGVAPGDQAVALDGLLLDAANLSTRLKRYRPGDTLELLVFRGDELLTLSICLDAAPENRIFLELDPAASEERAARQQRWLTV